MNCSACESMNKATLILNLRCKIVIYFHHHKWLMLVMDATFSWPICAACSSSKPVNAKGMHTNFSWKMKPNDHNLLSTLCQDTSPVPSLDGTAEFSPSWRLLRFGMELAITSWLAHQIIVRVVRVFNVSVFTADIKAESSVKITNQKCKMNNLITLYESVKNESSHVP